MSKTTKRIQIPRVEFLPDCFVKGSQLNDKLTAHALKFSSTARTMLPGSLDEFVATSRFDPYGIPFIDEFYTRFFGQHAYFRKTDMTKEGRMLDKPNEFRNRNFRLLFLKQFTDIDEKSEKFFEILSGLEEGEILYSLDVPTLQRFEFLNEWLLFEKRKKTFQHEKIVLNKTLLFVRRIAKKGKAQSKTPLDQYESYQKYPSSTLFSRPPTEEDITDMLAHYKDSQFKFITLT